MSINIKRNFNNCQGITALFACLGRAGRSILGAGFLPPGPFLLEIPVSYMPHGEIVAQGGF